MAALAADRVSLWRSPAAISAGRTWKHRLTPLRRWRSGSLVLAETHASQLGPLSDMRLIWGRHVAHPSGHQLLLGSPFGPWNGLSYSRGDFSSRLPDLCFGRPRTLPCKGIPRPDTLTEADSNNRIAPTG